MLAALRQGSAFRGNFSAIRRAALPRCIGSVAEYNEKYAASIADPEKFWSGVGKRLKWRSPYTKAINSDLEHGIVEFYSGGTLNVAENCIDRHLETKGDQAALIWEKDEPGQAETITYKELHRNVCRMANMYKAHGVKKGDVVTLYMPMVPEVRRIHAGRN